MTPSNRSTIIGCALLILAALVLVNVGCAKTKNENSAAGTGGGGQISSTPDTSNSAPSSVSPASAANGTPTTWQANAASIKGEDGQTFTLACAPGGTGHAVWGSDVYTADSSICTAAVHSGLITYEQGGTVTIELRPGRSIYGSSERNGVTTSAFPSYPRSYVFKTPNTDAVVRDVEDQTPVLWNTSATIASGENGKTFKFKCPPNGKEGAVWGSDIYTGDSSICSAAVHAGKLKMESGGSVEIEVRPGESSYKGSTRNGIRTNDYGPYGRSFVVR